MPWWKTSAIYQIYPRSFQDSNGDGVGDIPGIISRLDHINDGSDRSLRIGAIWLTPAYPSPNFDWGYDVADYTAIHPDLGTMDDFDRLVEEAKRREIRIVMDLVANHTSWLHPWFLESRSSRDNPKRDWYIWHDRSAVGGYPNNWASVFGGGSAWEWDETTQQFYFHGFLKQQPDLNWANPEVRNAIWDVMRFWMRRGVAGFRLDAIAHIGKRQDFPDNPLKPGVALDAPIDWNTQIHEYDMASPIMHPWLQEMRSVADEYGAMLVGEIYSLRPEVLASFSSDKELHSVFNFDLLLAPWGASGFRAAAQSFESDYAGGVWPGPVLDNHDNPRSFTRFDSAGEGMRRAAVAAVMLLTQRGTPYIYYGQEIGMPDTDLRREQLRDPVGVHGWPLQKGRDPERTPMQWNSGQNAGFSNGEPWLPMGDFQSCNVESESGSESSVLTIYKRLGAVRATHPALTRGTYRCLEVETESVWAYVRTFENERILVALNFGSARVTADLSQAGTGAVLLLATDDAHEQIELPRLTLAPVSGMILLLQT